MWSPKLGGGGGMGVEHAYTSRFLTEKYWMSEFLLTPWMSASEDIYFFSFFYLIYNILMSELY